MINLLNRIRALESAATKKDWRTEMGRPCEVFMLPNETTEQAKARIKAAQPDFSFEYATYLCPDED